MKKRNIFAVLILTLITLGIYSLVWFVKTKGEMKKLGASIPTAWLLIVPFVNIWWLWKYSEGVEHVTGSKISAILSFVLVWLLGVIGMMIVQYEFNKVGDQPVGAAAEQFTPAAPGFGPAAPVAAQPAVETVAPGMVAPQSTAPVTPEQQVVPANQTTPPQV